MDETLRKLLNCLDEMAEALESKEFDLKAYANQEREARLLDWRRGVELREIQAAQTVNDRHSRALCELADAARSTSLELRDRIALETLLHLMRNPSIIDSRDQAQMCAAAYGMADAMLEARGT